ncbi:MAG: hypothetical protein RBT76_15680, partial [candidate division Zixibacteria bacterium]|nr:hypothetical protein [candidate division Zixibacteria bacterium]
MLRSILAVVVIAAVSVRAEWPLSMNDYDDHDPVTSGKLVAWVGSDGTDAEIMLWNGKKTIPLTNNDVFDGYVAVGGKYVVWVDSLDLSADISEIFLWDGAYLLPGVPKAINISNTGATAMCATPHTDGKNVVWSQDNGNGFEIMLWDGKTVTQLTNNDYDDTDPKVRNGRVVWSGYADGPDGEIFYWDGDSVIRLTDNNQADYDQVIDDDLVAWKGGTAGRGTDVYLYDGVAITNLSIGIAIGNVGSLSISKACIAWTEASPIYYQVYLWEQGNVQTLTMGDDDNIDVANYGNRVAWLDDNFD